MYRIHIQTHPNFISAAAQWQWDALQSHLPTEMWGTFVAHIILLEQKSVLSWTYCSLSSESTSHYEINWDTLEEHPGSSLIVLNPAPSLRILHHLCHRQVPLVAIKAEWREGNFSVLKWLSLHNVGCKYLGKDPPNSLLWSILNPLILLLKLCKLNVPSTESILLAQIYLGIAKVVRMLPSDLQATS